MSSSENSYTGNQLRRTIWDCKSDMFFITLGESCYKLDSIRFNTLKQSDRSLVLGKKHAHHGITLTFYVLKHAIECAVMLNYCLKGFSHRYDGSRDKAIHLHPVCQFWSPATSLSKNVIFFRLHFIFLLCNFVLKF